MAQLLVILSLNIFSADEGPLSTTPGEAAGKQYPLVSPALLADPGKEGTVREGQRRRRRKRDLTGRTESVCKI